MRTVQASRPHFESSALIYVTHGDILTTLQLPPLLPPPTTHRLPLTLHTEECLTQRTYALHCPTYRLPPSTYSLSVVEHLTHELVAEGDVLLDVHRTHAGLRPTPHMTTHTAVSSSK